MIMIAAVCCLLCEVNLNIDEISLFNKQNEGNFKQLQKQNQVKSSIKSINQLTNVSVQE